ncbi:hypothetical protein BGZ60DRAFT_463418 [Tricladium varicosporioides]|nr:hypothetical protein BGZ60DRAFT_463418 [Hymenoscyphus varicosporioides]
MSPTKRSVLITGCSEGGLGAALAVAFHNAGLHVYATARNPSKMAHLSSLGIQTLTLDVLASSSISTCVAQLSSLDILINNAGAGYSMPISDLSIPQAKELFDLNVWSYIEVTQAFLPLLLKSERGMVVNQTSVSSVTALPFTSAYNASKAAIAMFSESLRLELAPFNIKVVDLKTGLVQSNLTTNNASRVSQVLPEGSIYTPAKDVMERALRQERFKGQGMKGEVWAKAVVGDLLKNKAPSIIWRGEQACLAWVGSCSPHGMLDGTVKKLSGLDEVERTVRRGRGEK